MQLEQINATTQPLPEFRLFNRWNRVSKGWFVLCPSRDLATGAIRSFAICGHQVAVFRGQSGKVGALDAFCPHMGLNLEQGRVTGDQIRCAFHGWRFDAEGACTDIPCQAHIGESAHTTSYAVAEQLGYIWIYPDKTAPEPPYLPEALREGDVLYSTMDIQPRSCHPHVATLNGIDVHHIKSVHKVDLDTTYTIDREKPNRIHYHFETTVPQRTWMQRLARRVMGRVYNYSISYIDGTLGVFTSFKDVKLFDRIPFPTLHLILAARWVGIGQTQVFPIAIQARPKGPFGYLRAHVALALTKFFYWLVVAGEGDAFFKDLRFRPNNLLEGVDEPSKVLISFFDEQEISRWEGTPNV